MGETLSLCLGFLVDTLLELHLISRDGQGYQGTTDTHRDLQVITKDSDRLGIDADG